MSNWFCMLCVNCISVISCEPFIVANGAVNITSLEYLGEARVLCHNGYWAENGQQGMNVTCEANKNWTITPTCEGKCFVDTMMPVLVASPLS